MRAPRLPEKGGALAREDNYRRSAVTDCVENDDRDATDMTKVKQINSVVPSLIGAAPNADIYPKKTPRSDDAGPHRRREKVLPSDDVGRPAQEGRRDPREHAAPASPLDPPLQAAHRLEPEVGGHRHVRSPHERRAPERRRLLLLDRRHLRPSPLLLLLLLLLLLFSPLLSPLLRSSVAGGGGGGRGGGGGGGSCERRERESRLLHCVGETLAEEAEARAHDEERARFLRHRRAPVRQSEVLPGLGPGKSARGQPGNPQCRVTDRPVVDASRRVHRRGHDAYRDRCCKERHDTHIHHERRRHIRSEVLKLRPRKNRSAASKLCGDGEECIYGNLTPELVHEPRVGEDSVPQPRVDAHQERRDRAEPGGALQSHEALEDRRSNALSDRDGREPRRQRHRSLAREPNRGPARNHRLARHQRIVPPRGARTPRRAVAGATV
mmetsp:Transcript_20988/g.67911  ORF Transcript_20988/g.67911 Transcript_20988/m.67911 type:complete len:438 (-) Transcript_20988:11-1324(-)